MTSLRIAFFALALLGSSMVVGQASAAMPVNGLTEASKQISSVDQVWYGRGRWGGGYRGWGHRGWGYRGYGYRRWGGRSLLGSSLLGPSVRVRLARWLRLAPLLVVIVTEPVDCGRQASA